MFQFNLEDKKYKQVHFIGIGGISMSGLAEILLNKGYKVTGTDSKDSSIISRLKSLGADIYIGHQKDNIKGADLIIYTDAISNDNEELSAAKNSKIPTIDRATFLGSLMRNYTYSIGVSGTHGKTTTTSMIASITNHDTLNPTVLLGGQLDDIGGNVKLGSDEYILTEACEYKANILKYLPTMAVILNVDEDHLDYFKDMNHIVDTFVKYVENLEEDGYLVINADDPHFEKIIQHTKAQVISFGIKEDAYYKAEDIIFSQDGLSSFTLNINNEEYWPIKLQVTGEHNIYNALASIVAAHIYGVSMEDISEYIYLYQGVHRRLELKGHINGVKIMDDYAHHPTEIQVTLKSLKNIVKGDIYCVFQPHTFTRTKALLNSFASSFKDASQTIITDIYAARELDNGEIHSKDLSRAINDQGHNSVYISGFDEIEEYLLLNTREGDLIVTMGAGNIYLVGESLLESRKSQNEKAAV